MKQTGSIIGQGASAMATITKKSQKVPSEIKKSPTSFSHKLSKTIIWFKKLPRLSKIIFLFVIVVAFVLAQSIFTTALSKQQQEQSIEYEATISLISQNILKAEAALSYGNESGAKDLLYEARNLLDDLPNETDEQKQKISELTSDINTQLEQTKHIATMATTTVANLGSDTYNASTSRLLLIGQRLYTFDPSSKTIYGVSIDNEEISTWPQTNLQNTLQYQSVYNNNIVYLTTKYTMVEFNTASETVGQLSFSLPADEANITSLATYENKIYLLDIKNNQIYRASRISGGYTQTVEWLLDDISLANATSMSIDGNIYLLFSDGTVNQFFQGRKQEWSLDPIEPALTSGDKIWTSSDIDRIFILDKKENRLCEFTKEGVLINQYVSDSFTNLKDFAVDWNNKTTYLLNGNAIVAIDILP